ncbi:hypothetical protein J2125_003923 [Erwinia toletana]|uniref:Uncharacterized protein n=1 Tax=Winslowiella toletana TaxID=92490 RepID=A0ABS4PDL5_9GAMM|nr:hypothetical protein [Winslowiella toletana]MBP2170731.1 hypothetical protein [Winslowiella toletana]
MTAGGVWEVGANWVAREDDVAGMASGSVLQPAINITIPTRMIFLITENPEQLNSAGRMAGNDWRSQNQLFMAAEE